MKKPIFLIYLRYGSECLKEYKTLKKAITKMDKQFYDGYSTRQTVIDYKNKIIFVKDESYLSNIIAKDKRLENFLVRVI